MSPEAATHEKISKLVEDNEVLLFIKGTRTAPQCGFSNTVIQILDTLLPTYQTVDVLSDPEIRDGIKVYSSWPTIPQLYVKGEFVGGCDIIRELFESGELQDTLGIEQAPVEIPTITITPAAAEGLRRAVEQTSAPEGELHLGIDANYRSSLSLSRPTPGEIEVESQGIKLFLDRMSAGRANGVVIDVLDTPEGLGFKVDNPNAPSVADIPVESLKELLDEGRPIELLDVRTPTERATASIPGSVLMSDVEAARIEKLPRDTVLVFFCHHGGRSRAAAEQFASLGFDRVLNVEGGIDAWSQRVDSSVPRY